MFHIFAGSITMSMIYFFIRYNLLLLYTRLFFDIRTSLWMILGPIGCLIGRSFEQHPLSDIMFSTLATPSEIQSYHNLNTLVTSNLQSIQSSSHNRRGSEVSGGSTSSGLYGDDTTLLPNGYNLNMEPKNDFWGPCIVISIYGAVLWLDRVEDVPWLYVIWTLASVFNHFVCRVFYKSSRLLIHYTLLGYSIIPILPFTIIIIICSPPVWMCTVLEVIAVIWSSSAAILSYVNVFRKAISTDGRSSTDRLSLTYPTIVLMQVYLITLIPIRPPNS